MVPTESSSLLASVSLAWLNLTHAAPGMSVSLRTLRKIDTVEGSLVLDRRGVHLARGNYTCLRPSSDDVRGTVVFASSPSRRRSTRSRKRSQYIEVARSRKTAAAVPGFEI